MITFIDLRGQYLGSSFAYFDTVTDRFVEFEAQQIWDNWQEFISVAHGDARIDRYRAVSPEWIFN